MTETSSRCGDEIMGIAAWRVIVADEGAVPSATNTELLARAVGPS